MKCNQAQPNLLDYSRGLLNPSETSAVRAHLNDCPECRAILDAEAELAGRLSAAPQPPVESDVWLRVQSRIRHESRKPGIFELVHSSFSRKAAAAVAMFAVILVALFNFAPWHTAKPANPRPAERESIKQAVAIMQVQPASDNTEGETTDAMNKVIDDEL